MNIIKRFAHWVLREDLRMLDVRIQTLQSGLKDRDKKLEYTQSKLNEWIWKASVNHDSILPQSAVKAIIECLPNPNEVTAGRVNGKSSSFSHFVRGSKIEHVVRLEKFCKVNDVTHAQVTIQDLNINITLPLRRHKMNYNMLGVDSEVETYYWDFNFSNIKIISDDVFDLISEFIIAQENVTKELKQEGLLWRKYE